MLKLTKLLQISEAESQVLPAAVRQQDIWSFFSSKGFVAEKFDLFFYLHSLAGSSCISYQKKKPQKRGRCSGTDEVMLV